MEFRRRWIWTLLAGMLIAGLYVASALPTLAAEKSIVCRWLGNKRTMRRISGRKPISSIRSASSSTNTCKALKEILWRPR